LKLIIIGTSTTARILYLFIRKYRLYDVAGFAVNKSYITCDRYCDLPVYAIEDLEPSDYLWFIAVQWNRLNADRRMLYENLKSKGFQFVNLISPNSVINGEIKGQNCWIHDGVIVDFGSIIGNNVFIKLNATIAENTLIEDHCFVGAKTMIAGECRVGEQSFIGIGSIVYDKVNIGKKCLISACSVIKRNVPDYCKVLLSSDIEYKQYSSEEIEEKLIFSKNVR